MWVAGVQCKLVLSVSVSALLAAHVSLHSRLSSRTAGLCEEGEKNENINDINSMLCPIKVDSNAVELTVHTSCYCVLDLLCDRWWWW